MIASQLEAFEELPRRSGTRAGRNAVNNRRARTRRGRYASVVRFVSGVAVLTLVVVVYLALMANVTRMNYELMHDAKARAQLVDETTRLDERLEALEARERLAKIAKQLGMQQAAVETVARLPQPQAAPGGVAFLASLSAWLH
jgi:cell division protein FtsL